MSADVQTVYITVQAAKRTTWYLVPILVLGADSLPHAGRMR